MRKILLALALLVLGPAAQAWAACAVIPALPDTERRTEYSGIVSQTGPFNVSFQLYGDSTDYANWLEVWVNGVKKTAVTDYTVTSPSGALGSLCLPVSDAQVTFTVAQSGTIEIVGARRPRRTSQVSENKGVTAHDFNQIISDLTAVARERWDLNARSLRGVPGETINPLPSASARALSALGFDSNGQPTPIPFVLGLGTVVGPSSAVDGHVACYNGPSGAIIKDCGPAVGSVSSVGLALPNIFSVSGTPVTGAGVLTGTLVTQSANFVFAGPTGGAAATPNFRALVGADLPNPSASTLGGIQSFAAVSSQWIRAISTGGVPSASQPAFTDISGTVAAAQLPNPSASTLGGVQSFAPVSNQWINTISTSGVPSASQPAFSNISGSVAAGQMPALTGDITTSAGTVATTIANNAVTNAKSAQMGAATFKCNPTNATANATDCTIQGLTARGAPDSVNDKLPLYDNAAGTIKFVTPAQIASSATAGVSSLNGLSGALSIGAGNGITVSAAGSTVTVSSTYDIIPGCRLTLETGVAYSSSDQSAKSTVYCTQVDSLTAQIYDGTNFTVRTMSGELSITLSGTSGNTAYDVYLIFDSGAVKACWGPAWSTSTDGAGARGTGPSSAQITNSVGGRWTNAVSMSCKNGASTFTVAANQGTLVGGFKTATADQVSDTAATRMLWDLFRPVSRPLVGANTASSYAYTSATIRQCNAASAGGGIPVQVSTFKGMAGWPTNIRQNGQAFSSSGSVAGVFPGIGLNSTSANSAQVQEDNAISSTYNQFGGYVRAEYSGTPPLGSNTFYCLEGGGTGFTFYGNNASTTKSLGLIGVTYQ